MAQLIVQPVFTVHDGNGDPLSGGKVYTYIAGTSTPKTTFTDSTEGTPNANPVILDARGQADVWLALDAKYKIVIKDSADVTINTIDNVVPIGGDLVLDLSPQLGANLDVNSFSIVSSSAGDVALTPDTTGDIILDGLKWPQADGTNGQSLVTDGAAQLSWSTPVVDSLTSVSGGDITITPDTTGDVIIDGLKHPQADGNAGEFLKTDGAGQLAFGTDTVIIDTTPQLGGDLDVNSNSIVSASNADIAITPNGTGDVILDGLKWPQADGTADYVLKTDGAAQLSWVAGSSSSSWTEVAATTASSSASVEFTGLTGYSEYRFQFEAILPATDSASLLMTLSIDNGSTYLAGTGYFSVAGSTTSLDAASWRIGSSIGIGNAAGEHVNGFLDMNRNVEGSELPGFLAAIQYQNSSSAGVMYDVGGFNTGASTSDVDAVKFVMSSGNIASGTIRVFGR